MCDSVVDLFLVTMEMLDVKGRVVFLTITVGLRLLYYSVCVNTSM